MMATLDRITHLEPEVCGRAVRHVPHTLDVFTTHFPLFPVLPGVLILDDVIELARTVLDRATGPGKGDGWAISHVRRVRFRHFVEPGDSMDLEVVVIRLDTDEAALRAMVRVDGKPVTTIAELHLCREAGT